MSEYFFNPLSIPYFLSFIVSAGITGLLIIKRRDDGRVMLFMVFMASLTTLSFTAGMATSSRDIGTWDFWNSINGVATTLGVTAIFHFSYVSLKDKRLFENRRLLLLYTIPLFFILFTIVNPENTIVESPDTDLGIYGKEYTGPYSFHKPLFYLTIALLLFLSTINFFRTP